MTVYHAIVSCGDMASHYSHSVQLWHAAHGNCMQLALLTCL